MKIIWGILFVASLAANQKVVVVGGGLAGLSAAYRLQEKGLDVEVYEARGRVGGRVLSVTVEGHQAELGAQNLFDGGEGTHLLRLIDEMGLEIDEGRVALSHHCFIGGRLQSVREQLEMRHFRKETIQEELEGIARRCRNMKEVLLNLFDLTDPLYQVFSTRLAGYEGSVPEFLSTRYIQTLSYMLLGGLSAAHGEGTNIHLGWVRGGNSLLAEKLASRLKVHLNRPLLAIEKKGRDYELVFEGGTKRADFVVLAIPCSCYEDIDFGDAIPQETLSKIKRIQMGTNAKIVAHAPAAEAGSFVNDRMVAFYSPGKAVLTLYYTGEEGRFSLQTVSKLFRRDASQVEQSWHISSLASQTVQMAEDKPFVVYKSAVAHSWPNDRYAKGSYSCIAPGQEADLTTLVEVDGETVKALFKPVDSRIFFAGEHTSALLDVGGTMEAAVESGEKAARMLMRDWR